MTALDSLHDIDAEIARVRERGNATALVQLLEDYRDLQVRRLERERRESEDRCFTGEPLKAA